MAQKLTHTLLAVLLIGVIALIVMQYTHTDPAPKYVYTTTPVQTIEKRVVDKDTVINHYTTQVINEKQIVQQISSQIDTLRKEFALIKAQKDTFQIIQIQDTLINALTFENGRLYSIIDSQDSIITAQRYIINSKDTLIALARQDIEIEKGNAKKFKHQRNASLIGNGIGVIVIGGLLLTK